MTATARIDDSGATPALVLSGSGARPQAAVLDGRRARVDGSLTGRGVTWTARLPLAASRRSGPLLPLPSGDYVVRVTGADGEPVPVDATIDETMTPTLRVRLDAQGRELGTMRTTDERILRSVSSGIIAVDRDGIITTCNRAAAEMLLVDAAASVGQPLSTVLPPRFMVAL